MMLSKKNRGRKGFTVGELLIVVAIISVLSAVAIPILIRKLERAREAYDIHTMRQAASAAVELYYEGITDAKSAKAAGLKWQGGSNERANAYGVYNPTTGRFLPISSGEAKGMAYGKGTKVNGGTTFVMGNSRGAYSAKEDYTQGFVMIAIYPKSKTPHADIYWKTINKNYIGGKESDDIPNYSIRISLN